MRFKQFYLIEAQTTLGSDVNEILTGFHLLGGSWNGFTNLKNARAQVQSRKKQIDSEEFRIRAGRAEAQANTIRSWMVTNGFTGQIKKIWWIARPQDSKRIHKKLFGVDINPKKVPSDLLVQVGKKFLGITLKAVRHQGVGIKLKTAGIGDLQKIGFDFLKEKDKLENQLIKNIGLPETQAARKEFLDDHPELEDTLNEFGFVVLEKMRDVLINKLSALTPIKAKNFVRKAFLVVADEDTLPVLLQVVGSGTAAGRFKATASEVGQDKIVNGMKKFNLEFSKGGRTMINVRAGGVPLFGIRFKYQGKKLRSPINISTETKLK